MKIQTLWSHSAKSLSLLPVYLRGWPSALWSMMSRRLFVLRALLQFLPCLLVFVLLSGLLLLRP